jgi:F420-dependent oxidoreductase-like protein
MPPVLSAAQPAEDCMRFALMTEPQQGYSYDEILAIARAAEDAGFEAFFRSDHYASFPGDSGQPTTDAWATLAGLARETTRINLGVLVSPVTFRPPGNFAKVVTTVAEMADGRVEVGLGAGWNDVEHHQHGLAFPPTGERFAMLEEQLAILHGLWTEPDGWDFGGTHWQVRDAQFYPKPAAHDGRRHPNILVGGDGGPRMARLVARFADELNVSSAGPEKAAEAYARLEAACQAEGRAPASVTRSAMTGVLVGRDESEVRRRLNDLLRALGREGADADAWLAERRPRWVMGTPDEARAFVESMAAAGVERLMLQTFLPRDLELVGLLGEIFEL